MARNRNRFVMFADEVEQEDYETTSLDEVDLSRYPAASDHLVWHAGEITRSQT
jgi:hypothetical protein